MREGLLKKPVQERALELAERLIGSHASPESRYILGILKTRARGAQSRQALRQRISQLPRAKERMDMKTLTRDLDTEFSRYIRLRDTTLCEDGIRRGNCVTCGSYHTYAELQCGHWITRKKGGKTTTRWNAMNCHAQCAHCNKWKGGREPEHEAAIRIIHGQDIPERLRAGHKFRPSPDRGQMENMLKDYKARADEIQGARK